MFETIKGGEKKMFDSLKKGLYFSKMQLLFSKGLSEGKIVPFDNKFYEK